METNYFSITDLLLVTLFFNQVFCIYLPEGDHQQPSWVLQAAAATDNKEKTRYCSDWAVEIHGGSEMADQMEKKVWV